MKKYKPERRGQLSKDPAFSTPLSLGADENGYAIPAPADYADSAEYAGEGKIFYMDELNGEQPEYEFANPTMEVEYALATPTMEVEYALASPNDILQTKLFSEYIKIIEELNSYNSISRFKTYLQEEKNLLNLNNLLTKLLPYENIKVKVNVLIRLLSALIPNPDPNPDPNLRKTLITP